MSVCRWQGNAGGGDIRAVSAQTEVTLSPQGDSWEHIVGPRTAVRPSFFPRSFESLSPPSGLPAPLLPRLPSGDLLAFR